MPSWGLATERDKVQTYELLRTPFVLPDDMENPQRARKIVRTVAETVAAFERRLGHDRMFAARREVEANRVRRQLEPLIHEYYDIDAYESMLVADTIMTVIPSITPTASATDVKTLGPVRENHRREYVAVLCDMLNTFARTSGKRIEGHVLVSAGFSVVVLSRTQKEVKPYREDRSSGELQRALSHIRGAMQSDRGNFTYCRSLTVFDKNNIYVVKPMRRRNWTCTSALNDADRIASAVLRSGGGG